MSPSLRTLLTTAVCIWNPQRAGAVGGSDPPRDGRGWLGRATAASGYGLQQSHHPAGPAWSPGLSHNLCTPALCQVPHPPSPFSFQERQLEDVPAGAQLEQARRFQGFCQPGPLTSGSSSSISPTGAPFPGFLSLSRRSRIRPLFSPGWDTS